MKSQASQLASKILTRRYCCFYSIVASMVLKVYDKLNYNKNQFIMILHIFYVQNRIIIDRYKNDQFSTGYYVLNIIHIAQEKTEKMINQDKPDLGNVSVILIFLMVAIMAIFCISLLVVIIRKSLSFRNVIVKRLFFLIAFYIVSRMAFCAILEVKIVIGLPSQWKYLSGTEVQLLIKDSLILGQYCLVGLFLIVFEQYIAMCLKLTKQSLAHIQIFKRILYGIQILYSVATGVLFLLFNIGIIYYQALNIFAVSFNLLAILFFVTSFFYITFLMTGVLLSKTDNERIKKMYKYLLVLLFGRFISCGLGFVILVEVVDGNFRGFINLIQENRDAQIIQCVIFIGYILYFLLTQGIQLIYSLRKSTTKLFCANFHLFTSTEFRQTDQLRQNMLDEEENSVSQPRTYQTYYETGSQNFKTLQTFIDIEAIDNLKSDVWSFYRGQYRARFYFIRKAEQKVSNYLIQDIARQLEQIRSKMVRQINPMNYFVQHDLLFLFEPYRDTSLDQWVETKCDTMNKKIQALVKIGKGIQKMHEVNFIHGALRPKNIFFIPAFQLEKQRVIFTGFGLRPLRRYLAMTTDYSNKTCYTAVQHLKQRNNVVLKPTKESDVYSFGMIIYEIITGIKSHRDLTLQALQKMVSENTRPKIPNQCPQKIKKLIRKCWQEEPQKRPQLPNIIFQLENAFNE